MLSYSRKRCSSPIIHPVDGQQPSLLELRTGRDVESDIVVRADGCEKPEW